VYISKFIQRVIKKSEAKREKRKLKVNSFAPITSSTNTQT